MGTFSTRAVRTFRVALLLVAGVALLLPVLYVAAWVVQGAPPAPGETLMTTAVVAAGLALRLVVAAIIMLAVIGVLLPIVYGIEGVRQMSLRAAGFEHVAGLTWRGGSFYTPAHAWMRRRAEAMRIGLDDLAGRILRHVDGVVLPAEGTLVTAGAPLLALARGTRTIQIPSPIDGVVRRVNHRLTDDPAAVVRDPYRRGWLVEVEPSGKQPAGLRNDADARTWFASESLRLASAIEHATGVIAADGGEPVVPLHFAITDEQFASLVRDFLGGSTPAAPAAA